MVQACFIGTGPNPGLKGASPARRTGVDPEYFNGSTKQQHARRSSAFSPHARAPACWPTPSRAAAGPGSMRSRIPPIPQPRIQPAGQDPAPARAAACPRWQGLPNQLQAALSGLERLL